MSNFRSNCLARAPCYSIFLVKKYAVTTKSSYFCFEYFFECYNNFVFSYTICLIYFLKNPAAGPNKM